MARRSSQDLQPLVRALLAWFAQNARDLPWRRTTDPYAIWVSEVMLQQTQVQTVIPYWQRWMRQLPDVVSLAQASSEQILKLWEGLGYYRRVHHLHRAAQAIAAQLAGKVPENFDELRQLPGIGRYTAGAICSIAFDHPTAILDGNIIRVLARIHGIHGNVRERTVQVQLWDLAQRWVDRAASQRHLVAGGRACSALNQGLMELGALVCKPKQPLCLACPVRNFCHAFKTQQMGRLPNLGKRPEMTARKFVAFAVCHRDRVLVRQRPANVVNAHLWEFPNVELMAEDQLALRAVAKKALGRMPGLSALRPLCTIDHSITRYRIRLEAFRWDVSRPGTMLFDGLTWARRTDLEQLAFPSAHRKIAAALVKS